MRPNHSGQALKGEDMRRTVIIMGLLGLSTLTVMGCRSKPKNGECKSDKDCAEQAGYGKVCVNGTCRACSADTDCTTGFVCRSNECLPKPQCGQDADCPAGQTCQGEKCVARAEGTCGSDRDCREGTCQSGRCVVPVAEPVKPPPVPAECTDASAFTLHFAFDKSTIEPTAQRALGVLADCLARAPARRVVIAGNADQRGTIQYNQALGTRRAEAARRFLEDLGASTTIDTISYGEQRPVCTEHKESCWSRNRRADFQIER
jgi:peptidoglycan-associated lipoprotein